jgi:SAM-dependent methyltransferase
VGVLLDYGCGSGNFLETAQTAKWQVVGVDLDPIAVSNAKAKGYEVFLGDFTCFDNQESLFDVITMNHVIEHVHQPVELIEQAFRLLKKGGQLFIEYPNINSYGHLIYKESWRGLEPPRHLVFMSWSKITSLLQEKGFTKIKHLPSNDNFAALSAKSRAIKNNQDPYKKNVSMYDRTLGFFVSILLIFNYEKSEFITLIAFKDAE